MNLIVFVPITKEHPIDYQEEDAIYRKIIDKNFKKIYRDEIYDVFPGYNHPRIIEIWDNPLTRIKKLKAYLMGEVARFQQKEELVLEKDFFIENILPTCVLRKLSDAEMAVYRRPYKNSGELVPIVEKVDSDFFDAISRLDQIILLSL
ncbi:MAG: hypothetical protein JSR33_08335 [Proteobacteria bacterium]|nr:hypothetical protein [Pseudomonadota bacterium]